VSKPLYQHNCNRCIYLGTVLDMDIYVCPYPDPKDSKFDAIIIRCSSDEPDNRVYQPIDHDISCEHTTPLFRIGQAIYEGWRNVQESGHFSTLVSLQEKSA